MTQLEKHLYQLRRIEKHREAAAEKEIRKVYKDMLQDLNGFLGNIYASYSEDDMLDYSMLAKAGMDARFLEEVEQRINGISTKVAEDIQNTVSQTYEACYDGMVNAVTKAAGNREVLKQAFSTVTAVTPDVIKAAVNNPVSGLTLKDTLEKHRKEIIYDIKRNIGVGLSNGDRFSTMSKRISESIDGDYTKAVRIVRTEAHRVREMGFNDAATDIDNTLKQGNSGYVMAKTWHTMQDERVRPNTMYRTKGGWKAGKKSKYNHEKMDGVTIPQDALFELPSGAKCKAPSQTGVAGEDINCRCYVSYDLVLASELKGGKDKNVSTIPPKVRVNQQRKITPKKTTKDDRETREQLPYSGRENAIKQIAKDINVSNEKAEQIQNSIEFFTNAGYKEVRNKDTTWDKAIQARQDLEEYISKAPLHKGTIYRGTPLDEFKHPNFKENLISGCEVDMGGISSWTDDIKVAEDYAARKETPVCVLYKCNNKSGVGIQHLSSNDQEKEVLHSENSKFIVTNVSSEFTKSPYDPDKDIELLIVELEEKQ